MCEPRCRSCDEPSGPNTTVPWSALPGVCVSCAEAFAAEARSAELGEVPAVPVSAELGIERVGDPRNEDGTPRI